MDNVQAKRIAAVCYTASPKPNNVELNFLLLYILFQFSYLIYLV